MRRSITEAEILDKRTPRGGWTKEQLNKWGVPWPRGKTPPKNWKCKLLRFGIPYVEAMHRQLDAECDSARDRDRT